MNKITLIDYLSLSEKELLVEQLGNSHTVLLEELTKLANNKLFKVQSSFTVKQNEIYDFHMIHAIKSSITALAFSLWSALASATTVAFLGFDIP